MTTASVRGASHWAADVRAQWAAPYPADTQPGPDHAGSAADLAGDPLASLALVLDRELIAVRRHRLDVEAGGRLPGVLDGRGGRGHAAARSVER